MSQSPLRRGLYSDSEMFLLQILWQFCHNPLFVGASIRTPTKKGHPPPWEKSQSPLRRGLYSDPDGPPVHHRDLMSQSPLRRGLYSDSYGTVRSNCVT